MIESILIRQAHIRRLIAKKKWTKVRSFLKPRRNANSQIVNISKDELGDTILITALFHDAPVDIISTLLHIDPLLSLEADACGLVPIHVACFRGLDADIIQLLLKHDNGASARALDRSGNSPLHLIIDNICDPSKCIKMAAVESCSIDSSAFSLDSGGISMSQDAFNDRIRTVHALCALAPEMVRHANNEGFSAIDLVQEVKASCDHEGCSKWERADMVYHLLRKSNIQLYKDEKRLSEMTRYQPRKSSTGLVPSLLSSYGSSTISSGFGGGHTTMGDDPMDYEYSSNEVAPAVYSAHQWKILDRQDPPAQNRFNWDHCKRFFSSHAT